MKTSIPEKAIGAGDPLSSTADFYNVHADEYFQRTVNADVSIPRDIFLQHIPIGGRILDAGCGSGRDLKDFANKGFQVEGIDASEELAARATAYAGVPCVTLRLQDMNYCEQFDGIWACASLLHVPKTELLSVLARLQRALVPGGILFASLQIGDGEVVVSDGRFFAYYQPDEIRVWLEQAKLRVERLWISDDSVGRQGIRWINLLARRLRAT